MARICLYSLILLFGFLSLLPALAQEKWDLEKDEDGIAVYTRKEDKLPVKQVKVVCELPGTTAQLVRILKDVENHSDWVYLNRKTVLLQRKSDNALVYYTEADMPWPVKDRDMVVESKFFPVAKNKPVRVEVSSIPTFVPEKSDFVRIPYSLAVWEITQLPKNRIKVQYTFSADPGGSLPAWLVNTMVTTGPHHTFIKLREILAKQLAASAN